jgi:hypothetical protein
MPVIAVGEITLPELSVEVVPTTLTELALIFALPLTEIAGVPLESSTNPQLVEFSWASLLKETVVPEPLRI